MTGETIRAEVTLADVARRADVHPATVSRFLSKPELLSGKTADKVREAIEALGYVPNALASTLASNRRNIVALVVPRLAWANSSEVVEEISSELTSAGSSVLLCITDDLDERTNQLIDLAMGWRVDAIIAWAHIPEHAVARIRRQKVTVLEIGSVEAEPVDVGIGFSTAKLGVSLADFLARKKYRRPLFLMTAATSHAVRFRAFCDRWKERGEGPVASLEVPAPADFLSGGEAYRRIRALPEIPDVVVCPSDYLAQSLIVEASAEGLTVPDAFAVVGVGNTSMSAAMRPSITTVDLDTARIPKEALAILQARRRGDDARRSPLRIELDCEIVERESA